MSASTGVGSAVVLMLMLASVALAGEVPTSPAPDRTQGTADEPFIDRFSPQEAAKYLDARAHLSESSCYACHSTFAYLPARSAIDPLAAEVMRTRILLERFLVMVLDPARSPDVKTMHIPRVRVLAAVELARHDAVTTGKLAPLTRRALDSMWQFQRADGSVSWIHVGEAPQAIDDYWPVAMMALGAGAAPENYAQSAIARAGIEKLRGWLRAHPPKNLHERGLTLLADAAIGDLLSQEERGQHAAALLAKQHDDGGWSIAELASWQRPDKRPLDPMLTDGYATGLVTLALARSGVPRDDPRLLRGVEWLKTHQRRSGGWFTPSPFKRDQLASNTGSSMAIQALAACGEIDTPKISDEQFAAAHAAAEKSVPAGTYLPNAKEEPGKDVRARLAAVVSAAGGEARLLRLFRIKERLVLGADPKAKASERVSVLAPPQYWWMGKVERVKDQKEPATFLVWAWTLGALTDAQSKLELLSEITEADKPAFGIRVSGTINPPMDLYFDRAENRLVRIDWRADIHRFSDWKEHDGVHYPARCVGSKKATGQPWYFSEIVELERLKELPAGLKR